MGAGSWSKGYFERDILYKKKKVWSVDFGGKMDIIRSLYKIMQNKDALDKFECFWLWLDGRKNRSA